MESTHDLATCIDAAFASMKTKRSQSQEVETHRHEEWKQRLARLGAAFDTGRCRG